MRRFLITIGACTLGLFACTGMQEQGGVTVRTVTVADEGPAYTYRADVPQVHGLQDHDAELLVNRAIAAAVERERRMFIRDAANVSLIQTGATLRSGLTVAYRVERADERIVSLLFVLSPHLFGERSAAHFTLPFNYDLEQRRQIALDDVLEGAYPGTLSKIAITQLTEQAVSEGFYTEEIGGMIAQGAAPRRELFTAFTIGRDALVIHFDPASVAPYERGIRSVSIPARLLNEYLRETGKMLVGTNNEK